MMTKNFKRNGLGVAFAVATLFAVQPAAAAPLNLTNGDKITLSYGGGANGDPWGGGEFLASGVAGSVLHGPGDSFITLCVEYTEEFYLNSQYFVKINTGAVNGGISNAGTYTGDTNGIAGFDPLSKATAWLYTQFRNNTLAGFSQTQTKENSLQLAIWKLEGELSSTVNPSVLATYNSDTVAQNWVSTAITQGSLWSDTGNVRILNLYDTRSGTAGAYTFSGNHQDQLYMTPVPEPETYAMMLAGLGLMGFVARRRRGRANM